MRVVKETMFSTLRSVTRKLTSQTEVLQSMKDAVNVKVPSRGVRYHFQGHKRNSPLFYYWIKEKRYVLFVLSTKHDYSAINYTFYRHHQAHAYMVKTTRSNKFPGHIDIYDKEGNREALEGAVERFKRLDFGAYIRVMIGRSNKLHQKTSAQKLRLEQHVFAYHEF